MGIASLGIVELIKDLPDDHAMGASGAVFGPRRSQHSRREKPVETPPPSANIAFMDAPHPSATPTFASRTPLHIGSIGLVRATSSDLRTSIATCSG